VKVTPCQREGYCIVSLDEWRQVGIDEHAFLYLRVTVDDAKVYVRWLAEDQSGQWIVYGAPRQLQRIQPVSYEVGCHPRGKIAYIVPSQHGGAAASRQAEHFSSRQCRRISLDALQQKRLTSLGQEMRAVIRR
jgi:hypothetical protein